MVEQSTIDIYLDQLPSQPKNEQTRKAFRDHIRARLEEGLPQAVERIWDLPAIVLHNPQAEYVSLLKDARDLYVIGFFYACVAMCGIAAERLVKDLFRGAVRVENEGHVRAPGEKALDQIERVEISGLIRFLKEAELLGNEAAGAAEQLGALRNKYAHARGKEPQADALKAISHLHVIVEDTISVFKNYEPIDGVLVRKKASAG